MLRRHRTVVVLLAAALVACIGLRVAFWPRSRTPIPEVPLEGASPAMREAIDEARARVEHSPDSADAWGRYGQVLLANHMFPQAIACFAEAGRLDESNPNWPYFQGSAALESGQARAALPALERAADLARSREEQLTVLYSLVGSLIDEGFLERAQSHLQKLAALESEGERTHYLRGLLAKARGDRAAARSEFERVLHAPSFRHRTHRLLAEVVDDPARAKELLAAANKLPPDTPLPNPFFERAAPPPATEHRLGRYHQLMREGHTEEALDYLRSILPDVDEPEIALVLAGRLMELRRFDEAAEACRVAIRLDARAVQAHVLLASAIFEKGVSLAREPERATAYFEDAIRSADAALKIQANSALAHALRGRCFLQLKKPEEAIAAFREATVCQPESAEYHAELGEALANAGKVHEGVLELETAVKLAPGQERFASLLAKWRK
jgi:tetratricopeptide (TPR) repeat protein